MALLVLRQLCLDDVGVQYERAHGLAVRVDNAGGFSRCRQAEHQLHPVIRLQRPVVDVHRISAFVQVIRAGGAQGEKPRKDLLPQGVALRGVDLGGIAIQRLVVSGKGVQLGDYRVGSELLHGRIIARYDALVQRPGLLALDHQMVGGNIPCDRYHALRQRFSRLRHTEARGGHQQCQQ